MQNIYESIENTNEYVLKLYKVFKKRSDYNVKSL